MTFAPGPGTMMHEDTVAWCEANIAGLEIARHDAVAGHHTPEDQPELLAASIATWADRHSLRRF